MTKRLKVRNLSKTFSGTKVLNNVSFDLVAGEIHALVGENGCGKSTFIKCLAGYHEPDPGAEVLLDGASLAMPLDSARSMQLGFSFIHQDLGLVPTLTVCENIALGRGFKVSSGWRIDWPTERRRAKEALAVFGAEIDPDVKVAQISQADRTIVAIARAFARSGQQGKVLVLDEPTAALSSADVDRLFSALRRVAAAGVGIIYVSHRLQEILQICDRVTVFRDGVNVATEKIAGMSTGGLVNMIIGRSIDTFYPVRGPRPHTGALLETCGLKGRNNKGASFTVGKGEIVGLAGLLGSGRSEIARMLFGLQAPTGGDVFLEGRRIDARSPAQALRAGIGFVPEDRLNLGGIRRMSVGQNISLPDLSPYWRRGWLWTREERRDMQRLVESYDIRPRSERGLFANLSGGNQQKAILARALRLRPKLLLLDEPVQGVDIGSKTEIYTLIEQTAASGTGVLVIDSDFEDLARLCHRVLVLRSGDIVADLSGEALTRVGILEAVFAEKALAQDDAPETDVEQNMERLGA